MLKKGKLKHKDIKGLSPAVITLILILILILIFTITIS
jgi:hypothetical protein